ncbi:ATP-binding cassette domain-containing protein [Streptosporangium sp. OZ121]|uniref:ATP-binding cassette domain-containing protein n=1 Tax=Streptosporangium sp. OZ121 TaxID=3444183 RepID=UPI003F78E88E
MLVSPVIEVAQLNAAYGEFHAVEGLSFQVARRELHSLLATNGAGKTSTLEVIEGRRTASAGTVRVFGRALRIGTRCVSALRPRMGMRPQESGFAADLTVAGVSGNGRQQSRAGV